MENLEAFYNSYGHAYALEGSARVFKEVSEKLDNILSYSSNLKQKIL